MRIRNKRIEKKMTQEKFGEIVGISKWTVINWESGKRIPLATYLPKISSVLGVSVDYLLDEEKISGESSADVISHFSNKHTENTIIIAVKTFEEIKQIYATSSMEKLSEINQNEETILLEERILKCRVDPDRPPFAVIAEAPCISWGIARNALIIINPSENVMCMDVALISYYDKFALKKVHPFPNGSTELISENGNTISVTAEENTMGVLHVYGKAVCALSYIKHGI